MTFWPRFKDSKAKRTTKKGKLWPHLHLHELKIDALEKKGKLLLAVKISLSLFL